jgi:hypothetical protein
MIVGHYAAALIPYSRLKEHPFWLLLLCANVPEFLWLVLAVFNVEPVTPPSILDATFQNLHVAMTYSHNLIPGLLQGAVVAGLVYAWRKNRLLALWCGFLTTFHVLSDLVVGFDHQLLTADSRHVSMNTYGTMPNVAIMIELAFSIACVFWYQHSEKKFGRTLSRGRLLALYAVFIVGIAAWFPSTTTPLRAQLQALGIAL